MKNERLQAGGQPNTMPNPGNRAEMVEPPSGGCSIDRSLVASGLEANFLPFVTRRLKRIRTLITALTNKDMRADEIAGLLECSITSAGRDMVELRRAGVVTMMPAAADEGAARGRPRYRLTSDVNCIRSYLTGIANPERERYRLPRQDGSLPSCTIATAFGRRVPMLADDAGYQACGEPLSPARDPLVAALFGNAVVRRGAS